MGVDEQTKATPGEGGVASPNGEIPEEPPKIEDIITPDVLEAITKGYKRDMKCVSFQAEPGTTIGDNYMSTMYAVDMKLESSKGNDKEVLKVMLKTMPRNIVRSEMINEMRAFGKETAIYQELFPLFTKLQEDKGIPKANQFEAWPKCYAAYVDGSTDYLAMENLRVDGFKMADRITGFDFNHCALVLRQLARYHALSYVGFGGSREAILEALPMLEGGMFSKSRKDSAMTQEFFGQSLKSQSDIFREKGETLVANRLERLSKIDFIAVLGDLMEKDVEVAVVTHRDCWVNNMLFAYDDCDRGCRLPTKFKFLDFQLSTASSRLVDVHMFLLTSAKMDMLAEYEQDLLMIYYTEFTSFAQSLGVDSKRKGLTWENFLNEGDRYRFYGIVLTLILAPMLAASASDAPDMDSFTKEDLDDTEQAVKSFYKDLEKSPALKKAKVIMLKYLPKCTGLDKYL